MVSLGEHEVRVSADDKNIPLPDMPIVLIFNHKQHQFAGTQISNQRFHNSWKLGMVYKHVQRASFWLKEIIKTKPEDQQLSQQYLDLTQILKKGVSSFQKLTTQDCRTALAALAPLHRRRDGNVAAAAFGETYLTPDQVIRMLSLPGQGDPVPDPVPEPVQHPDTDETQHYSPSAVLRGSQDKLVVISSQEEPEEEQPRQVGKKKSRARRNVVHWCDYRGCNFWTWKTDRLRDH